MKNIQRNIEDSESSCFNIDKQDESNMSSQGIPARRILKTIMLACCFYCPCMFFLLPVVALTPQPIDELIYDYVSRYGLNKSGELSLFWIMSFLTIIFAAVLLLWKKNEKLNIRCRQGENSLKFLMQGTLRVTLTIISGYYALTGLLSLFITSREYFIITVPVVIILVLMLTMLILNKLSLSRNWFALGFVFSQLCIPLNLLIFLKSTYLCQNKIFIFHQPTGFYGFFLLGIVVCYACSIRSLLRIKTSEPQIKDFDPKQFFLLSGIVVIAVFNSYYSPIRMVPVDAWHHGEQVAAWTQTFGLGQVLYCDYMPASGLHPLVVGGCMNIFLDGKLVSIPAANCLVMVVFAALTCILVYLYSRSTLFTLFMAMFYGVAAYNRYILLAPALLILSLPWVIQRRQLWLRTWVLICFVCGLYYPSCGAAVMIGGVPFAFVQIYFWLKKETTVKESRRISFWLWWGVCLLPIILAIPLLLRMAGYVSLAASQTVLADGIPLMANYMKHFIFFIASIINDSVTLESSMKFFYYAALFLFRITIPMLALLIPVVCLIAYLRRTGEVRSSKLKSPVFFCLTSIPLSLAVLYSYTLVRSDYGDILMARTAYVILPVMSLFFVTMLYKYGKNFISSKLALGLMFFWIIVGFILQLKGNYSGWVNAPNSNVGPGAFLYDAEKLNFDYVMPENFLAHLDKDTAITRLGDGFMENKQFMEINTFSKYLKTNGLDKEPILNMNRLFYSSPQIRCGYTEAFYLLRSEQMQKGFIDYAEKNGLPLSLPYSSDIYLIYRWMRSRNYKIIDDIILVPPEVIHQKPHLKERKIIPLSLLCRINSTRSMGRSMERLMPLFEDSIDISSCVELGKGISQKNGVFIPQKYPCSLKIKIPREINSTRYDFLYLDFDFDFDMAGDNWFKKLIIKRLLVVDYMLDFSWSRLPRNQKNYPFESEMYFDGKYLLPLGFDNDWLDNRHSEIFVTFIKKSRGTNILRSLSLKKAVLLQRKLYKCEPEKKIAPEK